MRAGGFAGVCSTDCGGDLGGERRAWREGLTQRDFDNVQQSEYAAPLISFSANETGQGTYSEAASTTR